MTRRWLAPLCLLVSSLAAPAFAQIDKGSIEAVALDQSETPLPGVTITVRRPETGYETIGVTDVAGTARFPALTPGNYEVTFSLEGFAPAATQRITLRVGQEAKLSAIMHAAASESITVSAEAPVVDVHKTDSSTNIIPEQIEALPVPGREFERLAFLAPGVQRERGGFRFINGGPVIGAGGNASQATIFVNGVDLTDQVNGLARARFSQDAVREFRVITNRFDSEIGGSAGGALSIVTKSGTNDLHGSVLGFFRDAALQSQGALETRKNDDYARRQLGFNLGGPIVPDKAFYFASLEQINEDNITFSTAGDFDFPTDQTLLFGSADVNINASMTGGVKLVHENYELENFRVGTRGGDFTTDQSYGQTLERKNWNGTAEHNWSLSPNSSNELRAQYGKRRFFEPTNSDAVAEWFFSGNALKTGGNILGDLLGDGKTWELRDTFHHHIATGRGSHDLKAGASVQWIEERFVLDTYATGLFIYVTGDRSLPLAYAYGVGSSDVTSDTNVYGAFVEDSWRPNAKTVLNFGVRYDVDTNGNNEGFTHPLIPDPRESDTDNFQPRFSFSYDLRGDGTNVLRGGAGLFTGRMLLVPALTELQQNGVTGRVTFTRINGALLGLPQFALDPNNPTTTGIPSKPSIALLSQDYHNPEATQASLGYTMKLGASRLFLDTEAIYVKGEDEIVIHDLNWNGNAAPANARRPFAAYDQVNVYDNSGRSEYKALVLSLNGNIRRNDLITASVTFSDKKNISDDFSPDFPTGYPNDPAAMDAEYGYARGHERYRIVLSGVFHAPWDLTIAPIFEYGSGQPWTHRLGYDANGDGKNSDRPAGVGRNEEDGPPFRQLSLRVTKSFQLPMGQLQAIAEAFNVTNVTNYDVQSIVSGEFLSGPTAANPAGVRNPRFGEFNATLPAREFQLGVRWVF